MVLKRAVRTLGRALWAGGRTLADAARSHASSEDGGTPADGTDDSASDTDAVPTATYARTGVLENWSPPTVADQPADPRQVGEFVSNVDPTYTARLAVDGTKRGLRMGPYGAVAGASAGILYGAYSSNRDDYDPAEPSGPIAEHFPIEEWKDEYATAARGYRHGKRFGLYGGLVGTALGAGVDVVSGNDEDEED